MHHLKFQVNRFIEIPLVCLQAVPMSKSREFELAKRNVQTEEAFITRLDGKQHVNLRDLIGGFQSSDQGSY